MDSFAGKIDAIQALSARGDLPDAD